MVRVKLRKGYTRRSLGKRTRVRSHWVSISPKQERTYAVQEKDSGRVLGRVAYGDLKPRTRRRLSSKKRVLAKVRKQGRRIRIISIT